MVTRIIVASFSLLSLVLTGQSHSPGRAEKAGTAPDLPRARTKAHLNVTRMRPKSSDPSGTRRGSIEEDVIALHQSTNSIVLFGDPDDMERIESIILRLDVVAAEKES